MAVNGHANPRPIQQNLSLHFRKLLDGPKKRGGQYFVEVWYDNKKVDPTLESPNGPEWNRDVLIENYDSAKEVKVKVRREFAYYSHAYGGFKFTLKDATSFDDSEALENIDNEKLSSEIAKFSCKLSFKASLQGVGQSLGDLAIQQERALQGPLGVEEESKMEDAVDKVNDTAEFVQNMTESSEGIQDLLKKAEWFMNLVDKLSSIHPFAKVGFEVLTSVHKVYKFQRERDKAVLGLIETMSETFDLVKQATPDAEKLSDEIQSTLLEIGKKSVECAHFVQNYCRQKTWKRFKNNLLSDVGTKVTTFSSALGKLKSKLSSQAGIEVLTGVAGMRQDLEEIGADVKEVKENARDQELRELLPHVRNEGGYYTAQEDRGCHPGTRKKLLDDIDSWINTDFENTVEKESPALRDDVEPSRLLVLTGLAGTGKSAIVHTLASRYREVHCLGGVFFFHPTSDTQTDLGKFLFPTIAHGLAEEFSVFKDRLYDAVKREKHPKEVMLMKDQYRKWIAEPLKLSGSLHEGPVLIFIDGLDECRKKTRDEFIGVLKGWVAEMPSNFRLVISSRSGEGISTVIELPNARHINLSDRDIQSSTSDDIKKFMNDRLCKYDTELRHCEGYSSDWIEKLAEKSEQIFQWAATARNFIEDDEENLMHRSERVKKLLANDPQTADMTVLDRLYVSVLQAIFQKDEGAIERFRSVMGTIFVLKQSLPAWTLEYLFKATEYATIIHRLAAVLEFSNTMDTPLRPLHSSFREFLLNENLSRRQPSEKESGYNFWVGPINDHQLTVTQTCLKLTVSKQMKGDFTVAPEALCEALRYTFRHWPVHYNEIQRGRRLELADDLNQFIWKRSMHWVNTLQKLNVKPEETHSEEIVDEAELKDMFEFQVYARNDAQDLLQRYLTSELLLTKISCFDVMDQQAIVGREKGVSVVECPKPPYNIFKVKPVFERNCDITAVVTVRRNATDKPIIISGWSDGSVTIKQHGDDKSQPIEVTKSKEPVAHVVASNPFSGWFVVVHKDGKAFSYKLQEGDKAQDPPHIYPIKTPSSVQLSDTQDPFVIMKNDMAALLCSNPRHVFVWDCEKKRKLASRDVPPHIPELSRILFQEIPSRLPFSGLAVVTKEGNRTYLCDVAHGFNTEGFLPPVVQLRLLAVRKFGFLNGRIIYSCKWEEGVLAAYDRRYTKPIHWVAKEVA